MNIIQPINTNVDISTHTHTNLLNGGKADLTDYGKSLPSFQEIQLQLHALTSNPVNIVVNEDVTVRTRKLMSIFSVNYVSPVDEYEGTKTCQFEEETTWLEWIDTKYNTIGLVCNPTGKDPAKLGIKNANGECEYILGRIEYGSVDAPEMIEATDEYRLYGQLIVSIDPIT